MFRARHLLIGLVPALLVAGPNPSAPVPADPQMPAALTKTYTLGGNNRLQYTIKWNDTGRTEPLPETHYYSSDRENLTCVNACRGQAHFIHTVCDTSCDDTCTKLHQKELQPIWGFIDAREPGIRRWGGQVPEVMSEMSAGARTFGADTPGSSLTYTVYVDITQAMKDPETGDSKYKLTVAYDHFNDKPCAGVRRTMMGHVYDVSVEWKVYRETEVDGKVVVTEGPSGTSTYGTVVVPENKFQDVPHERCECILLKEDTETGFLPDPRPQTGAGTGSGGTEHAHTGGVRLGEGFTGPLLGNQNLATIGFAVQAENMFEGQVTAMNPFNSPLSINVAPGTLLDTNDDGVQDMMIMAGVAMNLPAMGQSPGSRLGTATAKLRLACLEMNKREPTPTTKYRILPSRDPVLSRLAAITDKSRLRGPWDQARVWIYTDAATYDEIKKKMIPAPGMATYLRVMSEAASAGAPLRQKRYDKCFSPSLLSALDASAPQLSSFASETVQRDPSGVLAWAKGESARYATALAPTADKAHFESAAGLISTLCASASPQAQQAGLLLLKGVPDGSRAALLARDLSPAWALSWSSDAAVARDAKAMIEAYSPDAKAFYLANAKK